MEILRCEHLCKQYGTGNACVKALDDVSFSVEKGEFVSIIGPSGSGKSTLLHILGGVDRPTSGKVFVNGTELHSLKEDQLAIFRRRQIGLVYQFYNLLPVLTVDENIMLPHLLDGHPKDQGRLDQVVAEMGLVTGTGCQLSALTAACLAASPEHPLEAAAAAVCAMGVAGELAWARMSPQDGNATYRDRIIDAVCRMDGAALEKGANYEMR